jgi:hypothetical protein
MESGMGKVQTRTLGRFASVSWAWVAAGVVIVALWLYIVVEFRGQPTDDPYITYRYAYNLAHGNGFVYNVGERVQSTTTPLFTLVLAGGALLGFDIPTFAYFINAVSLLILAALCVAFVVAAGREIPEMGHFAPWIGASTGALSLICPVTTYGLGTEMPMITALAWGCWWMAARERWLWAAALAGLAAVTRGDGMLVGATLAIYFVATHLRMDPRRWPWLAAGIYLLLALPWYLFAWAYFGSPLPATLSAKVAQGTAPGATSFLEGLGEFWLRSFTDNPVVWVPALALVIGGTVWLLLRGRALALPVIWAALFIVGFSVLRVPRYPWYYSPLVPSAMLALVVGAAVLPLALARRVEGRTLARSQLFAWAVVTLLAGAVFLSNDLASPRPELRPRSQLYISVARWLAQNTPPNASVGAEEVGFIGYYSHRRIVDLVGLIQPDVAPHRVVGDNLWPLQKYQPDYIVAMPAWLVAVGQNPWAQEHYSVVRTFEWPDSDPATLLKRQ